jgi:hypothetical protein
LRWKTRHILQLLLSIKNHWLGSMAEQKPIVRLFLYAVYICFPSRLSADGE